MYFCIHLKHNHMQLAKKEKKRYKFLLYNIFDRNTCNSTFKLYNLFLNIRKSNWNLTSLQISFINCVHITETYPPCYQLRPTFIELVTLSSSCQTDKFIPFFFFANCIWFLEHQCQHRKKTRPASHNHAQKQKLQ